MAISCFLSFCLQGAVGTAYLGLLVPFAVPAPNAIQRRARHPWCQDSSPQMTLALCAARSLTRFCTHFVLCFDILKHNIICVLIGDVYMCVCVYEREMQIQTCGGKKGEREGGRERPKHMGQTIRIFTCLLTKFPIIFFRAE